jgi:hypothetical protein
MIENKQGHDLAENGKDTEMRREEWQERKDKDRWKNGGREEK